MLLEHRLSALLQLHLHSRLNTWLHCIGQRQLQDETRNIWAWEFGATYIRYFTVLVSALDTWFWLNTPEWHKPQIYFPWRTQQENIRNTHDSVNCRYSLGSTLTYINKKTVRFYVQTPINLLRKCLVTPDCRNMENMLIDFIWLNVQAKYLKQTILYHFKWNMALLKWPKCPQYMQRTW